MKDHAPKETRRQSTQRRLGRGPKRDKRFHQLLDKARAGNAEAVADLWREYDFDFEREEP